MRPRTCIVNPVRTTPSPIPPIVPLRTHRRPRSPSSPNSLTSHRPGTSAYRQFGRPQPVQAAPSEIHLVQRTEGRPYSPLFSSPLLDDHLELMISRAEPASGSQAARQPGSQAANERQRVHDMDIGHGRQLTSSWRAVHRRPPASVSSVALSLHNNSYSNIVNQNNKGCFPRSSEFVSNPRDH